MSTAVASDLSHVSRASCIALGSGTRRPARLTDRQTDMPAEWDVDPWATHVIQTYVHACRQRGESLVQELGGDSQFAQFDYNDVAALQEAVAGEL